MSQSTNLVISRWFPQLNQYLAKYKSVVFPNDLTLLPTPMSGGFKPQPLDHESDRHLICIHKVMCYKPKLKTLGPV